MRRLRFNLSLLPPSLSSASTRWWNRSKIHTAQAYCARDALRSALKHLARAVSLYFPPIVLTFARFVSTFYKHASAYQTRWRVHILLSEIRYKLPLWYVQDTCISPAEIASDPSSCHGADTWVGNYFSAPGKRSRKNEKNFSGTW